MHPLFNSSLRFSGLLLVWLTLATGVSWVLSQLGSSNFTDGFILFAPLYFLSLIFILPVYYVCRGLPISDTSPLMLIASHGLTLLVALGLWSMLGSSYASWLAGFSASEHWLELYANATLFNSGLLALLFGALILLHYLYFALDRARQFEQAALQQKLMLSQAELQTLRATVHPHFLFNSLNTLANITLKDSEKSHRLCHLLADFLRYSVAYNKQESVLLRDELEHIQNYLGIERERFGERLKTEFAVEDDVLDVELPPLILFPVVENAIKHGIDSLIEGGTLHIEARANGTNLLVRISNPLDELGQKARGTGHGLASLEQRLKSRYGEHARLQREKQPGCFAIALYIPIQQQSTDAEKNN